MRVKQLAWLVVAMAVAAVQDPVDAQAPQNLTQQVRDAERAFAQSMATRNLAAFSQALADEAVFFGREGAQRGKAAVIAAWTPFFNGPAAPFSWEPTEVEVLDSGTLGLTSGPVKDPAGKQIGVFNSIWRRDGSGWKIVFDKGCPPCDCAAGR
jgi:ketosteroid isomerase-like protein